MMKNFLDESTYDRKRREEWLFDWSKKLGVSRRRLLQLFALGAGTATATTIMPTTHRSAIATSPSLIKQGDPQLFIQHSDTNLEMQWGNLYNQGYLTPNNHFFVRNNAPTPQIDPVTWQLQIKGSGVSRPLSLSYDQLLSLPSRSTIKNIECAGNGRRFYERASGTQWGLGAIGVAEWTGIPLAELLDRAGIKPTARDVMPVGLDEAKVQRPISVEKALQEDTLLVYAMNGERLPPDHGFPVRLLVPGWVGVANVKWVGEIVVSESPIWTLWNTEKYILIGEEYQPPANTDALGVPVTEQKVKSAFELPWEAELRAGKKLLRGRSWSSQGAIAKVEVSTDGGQSWRQARLREPNLPQAWVRWDLDWEAQPGSYRLQAKATDNTGTTQPGSVPFNEKGYLYWAVVSHPVRVS